MLENGKQKKYDDKVNKTFSCVNNFPSHAVYIILYSDSVVFFFLPLKFPSKKWEAKNL